MLLSCVLILSGWRVRINQRASVTYHIARVGALI
nr:MAG TPA: hypothetical protein [Caudoviricetes sp.]